MQPRKILRISRWELTKNADGIDRKTVLIVLATFAVLALIVPLVVAQGVALDQGIYRVAIDDDSPIYPVVEDDETFAVVGTPAEYGQLDLRAQNVELVIEGSDADANRSPKAQAALSELHDSITGYNDRLMVDQENQTAAFPVTVTLQYVERNVEVTLGGDGDGGDGGTGGTGGTGGGGSSGGGSNAGSAGGDGGTAGGGGGGIGGLGGLARSLTGSDGSTGAPSDISPPFPFQSLVLAFVFVLPLNFVIQAYGSTILSERLNRRGELMLVSPVSRGDIIAGKTLPYFAGAMVFEGLITGGIMYLREGTTAVGGLYSILAVLPLVLLFLGATFLGAMFARSFKELTFVTVAITVSLTSYAFVPAIFTDVTPIALISPLTIVVRALSGQVITATALGFSTLPPLLTATLFFGLGAGLYREEDMFTQRRIPLKVLDALAGRIKRARSVALVVAMLMPFVFVTELVAVAALFAVPQAASIPMILIVIVVIEEIAKGLPIYAGFVHGRYDRSLRTSVIVGALAGFGFFLAEKGLLLVQLLPADLPEVEQAAVATSGPVGELGPAVALLLLLAPLALHVVTATATAIGGRRGRRGFAAGMGVAILIHFAYNFTVVSLYV